MEDNKNSIFALKTSAGQERNVARLLAMKADKPGVDIKSIVVYCRCQKRWNYRCKQSNNLGRS